MSRRIDIELTSNSDDGSWTWRAIGAREPKGVIAASLLPSGASVGDELRVEADFFVDGIEITAVLPPKGARKEPEFIELLGSGSSEGGVTTSLVPKRGKGRGDRDRDGRGRGEGRGRGRNDRGRSRDGGGGRGAGERSGRGRSESDRPKRDRAQRNERPAPPAKPKPKKLRPQRTHRSAALAALPEEQRPIAEQVLRGGIPGLRKAVEDQNKRNKDEGKPEIDPTPLVTLAESLLPGLKQAEWRDRADAALAGIDEVDLRDLRTVVVAAESNARSEETRALAEQLREAVSGRVDREHTAWLREMTEALDDERTVRALRMSSRPPKAGAPLPPDLTKRLVEAANAALSEDSGPQRWGTVLDAVAYSPIRSSVTPQGIPSRPNDELIETVKHLSTRVPEIAALFGIEPQKAPKRRRKPRSGGRAGDEGAGRNPRKSRSDKPAVKAKPEADSAEAKAGPSDAKAQDAPVATEPSPIEAQPEAVEAQPEAVEAQPEAVEAQSEAVEAQPEAVEAQPEAVEAQPEAVEAQPEAVEAQPGATDA